MATAPLVAIGIGVPYWVLVRLAASLPVRTSDAFLLLALLAWVVLAKSFVERNDDVDSLTYSPETPSGLAHRLIDQSLVGVGVIDTQNAPLSPLAATIVMPRKLQPYELPSELAAASFGHADDGVADSVQPERCQRCGWSSQQVQ